MESTSLTEREYIFTNSLISFSDNPYIQIVGVKDIHWCACKLNSQQYAKASKDGIIVSNTNLNKVHK